MKRQILILTLLMAALTGLRIALASTEEWTADEAYLYLVSQHLDWAYFEGPSGLPALMRLSEMVFGNGSLALRLPSILFSLLATLAALWAGRSFYSLSVGFWAAVALNLLPAFNLAGLRASDLLPFLTFWLLFAGFTARAIHASRPRDWVGAGVSAGLGLLFSYDFLLVLVALPAAAAVSFKGRREFCRPWIYQTLVLLIVIGVIGPAIWNARHDWISFSGQTILLMRTYAGEASLHSAQQLIDSVGPLPLLALAGGLGWATALSRRHPRPRLILVFAGLPALAAAYAVFRGHDGTSFTLAALGILSLFLANQLMASADLLRSQPALSRGVVATVLVASLAGTGFRLSTLVRTHSELPWSALEERLERARTLHHPAGERPFLFIAGDRDLAAGLGFFLITDRKRRSEFPPIFLRESQDTANQFALWPRYDEVIKTSLPSDPTYTEEQGTNPNLGRAALYIGYEAPDDLPQTIKAGFEKVIALEKIEVTDGDPLYLYLCENYQMAPL